LVLKDEKGQIANETKISKDAKSILQFLEGSDATVVMESGYNHERIYYLLKEEGYDVRVAHPLMVKAIANQTGVLLKKIGIREAHNQLRYDFKQIHGIRKFFETNAGRGLKPLDVKALMGTKYNYYEPTEEYLLEEYLKVVMYLTVAETFELKDKLERQIVMSDRKVGELERDNLFLQNRLGKIEQSYEDLKKLVESRMVPPMKNVSG
jgi:hypothetical protein